MNDPMEAVLIFPHQLFREHPAIRAHATVFLVEEPLFFRQFRFHQLKICFHRASMHFYEHYLREKHCTVRYLESDHPSSDVRHLPALLRSEGFTHAICCDVVDDWLERRLTKACREVGLALQWLETPMFLNQNEDLQAYFGAKSRYFQTDFYIGQRKRFHILLDEEKNPAGGKWSFDGENRLKFPARQRAPEFHFPATNVYWEAGKTYVQSHFAGNYGHLPDSIRYPCTFEAAEQWLDAFLSGRFRHFGDFEDAMVTNETLLHHSLLTPMLNVGLLTPAQILKRTLQYAAEHDIPLNDCEGFVRQIIGWREFIRGVYRHKGRYERTRNFWGFKRKIPAHFWSGDTGIGPVDTVIRRVQEGAYCHHIERLMVLGNFFLLCEFDPDEVYRWFMELFIDAYDWVMVPNVYGMSQFADGGIMSTKPYISGSNYLLKMSDFPKGPWQEVWDGLFWRFLHTHRSFFAQNPRLGMLLNTFDKMPEDKRQRHLDTAEGFLKTLDR